MLTRSNLEFQPDARTIANGSSIQFGLYNKGGLVGLAKATRGHRAVGRLLSAAILSVCSQHRWTTITVGLDNGTQPHVDWGNSELYPSLLLGLTHHCGGELWVQSAEGETYLDTPQGMLRGVALPTSASAVLFNGKTQMHGSLANGAYSSHTRWHNTRVLRTPTWRCFWMQDLCRRSPEAADVE